MTAGPFLTLLDPRAAVKGSRDPLGVQQIWSRLGRRVVANLTTVTSSVADFATLLLGCRFCAAVAPRSGLGQVELFLKWEQIAAYARLPGGGGFRGSEQASKRVSQSHVVPLGAGGHAQLLANQKTYGIWGLYTVAARSSGLIDEDGRLTPPGEAVVDALLVQLPPGNVERIGRLLSGANSLDTQQEAELLKNIAAMLKNAAKIQSERLREHLAYGGGEGADRQAVFQRQRRLADLLGAIDDDAWALCAPVLRSIAKQAEAAGDAAGCDLALHLRQICTAEALFAPAAALFELALASDGGTLVELAAHVDTQWGAVPGSAIDLDALQALQADLYTGPADRHESETCWLLIAQALQQRRYAEAVAQLVRQNATVMHARGGAAWIEISKEGLFDVRLRGTESGDLPAAGELPRYWRNAYFIEALRVVARQLRG